LSSNGNAELFKNRSGLLVRLPVEKGMVRILHLHIFHPLPGRLQGIGISLHVFVLNPVFGSAQEKLRLKESPATTP
jgi:hypothetical protein